MAVPPSTSIPLRLEPVHECLARRNRALMDRRDTIIVWRLGMRKTMPMDRRPLSRTFDLVGDRDLDDISPVGFDHRSGKLSVYQQHVLVAAIGPESTASDGPIVVTN